MQAIVLVILGLLFLLPLFQANTYSGDNRANYEMLTLASNLYKGGESWEAYTTAIWTMEHRTKNDQIYPIVVLNVPCINTTEVFTK